MAYSVDASIRVDDGIVPSFASSVATEPTFDLTMLVGGKSPAIANQYVVTLKDKPLSAYDGSIEGYKPTSSMASKNTNVTAKGMLNTKSFASKAYKKFLSTKQAEIKLHIGLKLKRELKILSSQQLAHNGFTTYLTATEVAMLKSMPEIKAISKVELVQLDTDSGPKYSGADKVWSGTATYQGSKGEGVIVGVIDSGISSFLEPVIDINDLDNLPDFHPSFADVGGDGYDHTNPLGEGVYLGECKQAPGWCNDKLIGIMTFGILKHVIINRDENDPRSKTGQDGNGHGTHTASTAAGNVVKNINTDREIDGLDEPHYRESFVYDEISGVAPHANIMAYKICNFSGSCNPSMLLEALEHAIDNGINVLNYSISGPPKRPWYHYTAEAFLNARAAGIHVAASAGNTGYGGNYTVQTPANAPWITSVAANSHDRGFNKKQITLTGGSETFELDSNVLTGEGATLDLPPTDIVYAADVEYKGAGTHTHTHSHNSIDAEDFFHYPSDAHDYNEPAGEYPVAYEHSHVHNNYNSYEIFGIEGSCGQDSLDPEKVTGKIVICNRGGDKDGRVLSRLSKGHGVKFANGAAMVLINTNTSNDNVVADRHTIPAIHLEEDDGEDLLDWLAEGEGHQASLNKSVLVSDEEQGGLMGAFSAKGPGVYSQNYLLPAISSAGVQVLAGGIGAGMLDAAAPKGIQTDRKFVYKTGTSMSAPHVAGMYALIESVRPEWTPAQAQSALMLTAGTELKLMGPMVRGEQTYDPAPLNYTGAGLARVDRAIATGLIMTETIEGYLAADPDGDNFYVRDITVDSPLWDTGVSTPDEIADLEPKELPVGWHGKPEKLNLASMSMGQCLNSCEWTRTFTATQDAIWKVSYTYTTPGLELTSDKDDDYISVKTGEDFSLTVTAKSVEGIETDWVDGRVVLTATDESIPVVTVPVTVEFIVGRAPEAINIEANRNIGQHTSTDFSSIGSEDITVTDSQMVTGTVYSGHILRNSTPVEIFDKVDESTLIIPINIPARSSRLVVEILETTSPDLDIYIGEDLNKNGYPEYNELSNVYFWSLTNNKLELLDYDFPRAGSYWIMVHNFGDIYSDESNPEFDPSKVVEDFVKLTVAITSQEDDEKSLAVSAPKEAYREQKIPVKLKWNVDMKQGDRAYGSFLIGTDESLRSNIGLVKVNMLRGEDDVKLELLSNDTDTERAGYSITYMANNSGADITYQMEAELPLAAELEQFDAVDYQIENGMITWTHVQPTGSTSLQQTLVFTYNNVGGYTDITPYVASLKNDEDDALVATTAMATMIMGRPTFDVEISNALVMSGDTVTLTALPLDMVIEQPEVTFQWQQISGNPVNISSTASGFSFEVAQNSKLDTLQFEFIGSNGQRQSTPIVVDVFVEGEDSKSGGSVAWYLVLLLMTSFASKGYRLKS